jgi:mono/diheme cytochrome c family protein
MMGEGRKPVLNYLLGYWGAIVLVAGALFALVAAGCGTADTQPSDPDTQAASGFALDSSVSSEPTPDSTSATNQEPEAEPVSPVNLDGSKLFADNCAVCHGTVGQGQDGWQQRNPDGSFRAPPHDATGHTWHHPDGLLFRTVSEGGRDVPNLGVTSGMPAFGGTLSPGQIVAVINFLRTLWGPQERDFQAEVTANSGDRFP